jgi:hypothetical protein
VDATWDRLRTDIKVLFLARAQFHPLHGFSLIVEDVDPSFAFGDLEARLRRIGETMT